MLLMIFWLKLSLPKTRDMACMLCQCARDRWSLLYHASIIIQYTIFTWLFLNGIKPKGNITWAKKCIYGLKSNFSLYFILYAHVYENICKIYLFIFLHKGSKINIYVCVYVCGGKIWFMGKFIGFIKIECSCTREHL